MHMIYFTGVVTVTSLLYQARLRVETCSSINFVKTHLGVRLHGAVTMETNVHAFVGCVQYCLFLSYCLSINFKKASALCQLNTANSSMTTDGVTMVTDAYFIFTDISVWASKLPGVCATRPCHGRERCFPAGDTHVCKTVSGPSSCAEVKQCSSTFDDGEYWLYPKGLSYGTKVKVYCHAMHSVNPTEYITVDPLTNKARFYYLHLRVTSFSKVRLHIEAMSIGTGNLVFAEFESGFKATYGQAKSCTADSLGSKFNINTTGTGLIVDTSVKWEVHGEHGKMEHFTRDEGVITADCGGNCGGCKPTEPYMSMQVNSEEVIPDNEATFAC